MLKTLILRFADPSAWRGLFMLIAAYGIELSPEQAYAVASFGMAAVGAFGLMPDKFEFKDYLQKAGGQASTWRGLVMIATAWGLYVSPEQGAAIAAFGMALVGGAGVTAPAPALERLRS
jgi:hypothetical protein